VKRISRTRDPLMAVNEGTWFCFALSHRIRRYHIDSYSGKEWWSSSFLVSSLLKSIDLMSIRIFKSLFLYNFLSIFGVKCMTKQESKLKMKITSWLQLLSTSQPWFPVSLFVTVSSWIRSRTKNIRRERLYLIKWLTHTKEDKKRIRWAVNQINSFTW